ncbi:carboxylate-amine ligase [Arthrobacter subterraneus]|uniref:Putative glutamate--cysteine ligase 2 n=2 Tax=Arthrobacter subterraneus TaxID=335973 RepID=A0A1G8KXF6_9MICC|nr:carboxylate-amine ligase [Arthrobacter subterraneus]
MDLSLGRKVVAMRTFGVEEEFLLINPLLLCPEAAADAVLLAAGSSGLMRECKQEQIETGTEPQVSLTALSADIRRQRATADEAAARIGVRIAALATSPTEISTELTADPRYLKMQDRFGLTLRDQLTCGCHVHVAVESDEEGVAILDRIRVWLPVLSALSTNSPFWKSEDSGYASYRTQAWSRWPTAGVYEVFGSAAAYHDLVETLIASEVPIDRGQIYFDARLSARHPTVEVRVADVCLQADDAVLQAALTRALVETAAREWTRGVAPIPMPAAQLRLAAWRASRYGLHGELLDPQLNVLRDARHVARSLFEHVRPVLAEQGEEPMVESLLRQTLIRGTGCNRQRAVYARTGSFAEVVSDAVSLTNSVNSPRRRPQPKPVCFQFRSDELYQA